MYRPPAFSIDDGDSLAIVAARPLAQLVVVAHGGAPLATPVPMIVRGGSLVGHLARQLVVHDDPAWTLRLVSDLSDHFESDRPEPWAVTDAPADWIEALVRGIVGIELVDLQVVGKHKMSQNRSAEDRAAVAAGLDELGEPDGSATAAVAAAIRATLTRRT